MRQLARVTVSMQELDRLKCIEAVVDGDLQPIRAAERLGLTTRQVRRLAVRYRCEGPVGLISKRRNRPSNNRMDAGLEEQVLRILRESYPDFGPTLATEKLEARHRIVQGDGAAAADRRRAMDSEEAAAAEDPAAQSAPRLHR
jgi:Winged helix-turn helix